MNSERVSTLDAFGVDSVELGEPTGELGEPTGELGEPTDFESTDTLALRHPMAEQELALLEAWEVASREQAQTPIVTLFTQVLQDNKIRESVKQHPAFQHFMKPTSPNALMATTEVAIDDIDSTATFSDDEGRTPSLSPCSDDEDDADCSHHVCQHCGHASSSESAPQRIPSRQRPRSSSTNSTTSNRSCGSAGSPPRNVPEEDFSSTPDTAGFHHLEQKHDLTLHYTICVVGLFVAVCTFMSKGFDFTLCTTTFISCCSELARQANHALRRWR